MGELQSFSSSNNPVFIVIMRNSRGKLFVYVAVLCVLCFIVFLLSNTHTSLKELEGVNEKCQQQRDSLSAQLQVVYEHKNRLEKSLHQEKSDHKHTKDVQENEASKLQYQIKDEKQKLENQISQLKTSYAELEDEKLQAENALKQQLKTVQTQKDAEIEKLQNHISELLSEKDKLEVSNNAYVWKIEQHESEINLCHLQLQQAKTEFNTCQEQLARHNLNTVNLKLNEKITPPEKKITETAAKIENAVGATSPKPQITSPKNQVAENDQKPENKTVATTPVKGKTVQKPHVMPVNNLGDGVLPKPLDLKPEDFNKEDKDIDAALEITDDEKTKKLVDDNLIDNNIDKGVPKLDLLNQKVTNSPKDVHNLNNIPQNGLYNEPQALPPIQFDRADEKDDHAGERGDDGLQYNNPPELRQQVELPDFRRQNDQPKDVLPNPPIENNDIAAQMNDMMNKSPGNVINNAIDQNVLGLPPNHIGAIDNKIQDLKNGRPFMHRGADAHRVMEDKNYEEDDDDRENDDEPPNGLAPMMKGNALQDNDFDDQENPDNGDNAKEEEGVMAAPK
ncbi:Golgi integral membrane protein 4 isoform X2 [Parasteatoda tepidariorum]|uniref:Golgi integral membrane protein 4 isoform X2 n=1 Tax=Parasteatoda tepidariorum TaxID=114398 RepID=UPI00077FD911|nr:Golgi integral membrane protein 4 isoform X2 [Parasteatoda tepidariorum]